MFTTYTIHNTYFKNNLRVPAERVHVYAYVLMLLKCYHKKSLITIMLLNIFCAFSYHYVERSMENRKQRSALKFIGAMLLTFDYN